MADYSYNELMKMQNAAIKRVNEMQKKAKSVVSPEATTPKANDHDFSSASANNYDAKRVKMPSDYLDELKSFASTSSYFSENEKHNISPAINPQPHNEAEKNTSATNGFGSILKALSGDLSADSDKALILSLILLLTEEKADEALILSLLYIIS